MPSVGRISLAALGATFILPLPFRWCEMTEMGDSLYCWCETTEEDGPSFRWCKNDKPGLPFHAVGGRGRASKCGSFKSLRNAVRNPVCGSQHAGVVIGAATGCFANGDFAACRKRFRDCRELQEGNGGIEFSASSSEVKLQDNLWWRKIDIKLLSVIRCILCVPPNDPSLVLLRFSKGMSCS